MTDSPAVLLDKLDGVATVTLNRPAVHNAFDDALIAELTGVFDALGGDTSVRIVVLAARGKSFSAGADLNWMQRMATYGMKENLADACALAALMETLNTLPQPVVGKVQGAAFGGGVGLVACCDVVVASEVASFCLSEVKLGLVPAVISPYVVDAIGYRQARRYAVTAERFDARTAQALGLVHDVVGSAELDTHVQAIVSGLLSNGPRAMVESKRLIRDMAHGTRGDAQREDTAGRIARIRASDEGREGLSAFLDKRSPSWAKP